MAPKQVDCPRCGARNTLPAPVCSGCGVGLDWVLRYWDEYVSGPPKAHAPLLLISDPNGFKELYALSFKRLGNSFRYAEAPDGDGFQTIELAKRLRPDLIIADLLRSGNIQSDQMIAQLKTMPSTCEIPILLTSAAVSHPLFGPALDAGAMWYLPKPFTYRELTSTVVSILSRGPAVWIVHPGIDRAACHAMEDRQWRVWTYDLPSALGDPVRMARIVRPDVIALAAGLTSALLPLLKSTLDLAGIPVVILPDGSGLESETWALDAGAECIHSGPLDADGLLSAIGPVLHKFGR